MQALKPIYTYIIVALIAVFFTIYAAIISPYFIVLPPLLAVGLLVFYMALFHTEKFIWLTVFFIPLSITLRDIGLGVGLSLPAEPLIYIIFLGFIFSFFKGYRLDKKIIFHPLTLIILFNLLWYWVAIIFSTDPSISLKFVIARSTFVGVFFILFAHLFSNPKNIKRYLFALLWGGFVAVSWTIIKHAQSSFIRSKVGHIMRPFFNDHGVYAAYLVVVVVVVLLMALYLKSLKMNKLWRLPLLLFVLWLLVGIVFSFTRAAWVSLVASAGLFAILYVRLQFKWVLAAIVLGSIAMVLNFDSIIFKMSGNKTGSANNIGKHVKSISNVSSDPSNLERINRWNCAIEMAKERPIFGFGPGTYTFNYDRFQVFSELTIISVHTGTLGNAHSEYFSVLTETGVLGLVSLILIFIYSIYLGFKIYYHYPNKGVKALAVGVMLGLVSYYVHGLLNNYSDFDKIAVLLWGGIAVLVALDVYHNKEEIEF